MRYTTKRKLDRVAHFAYNALYVGGLLAAIFVVGTVVATGESPRHLRDSQPPSTIQAEECITIWDLEAR